MESEFAPQYSVRERWLRIAVAAPLILGFAAAWQWWLLPMWGRFAENAHCNTVFGFSGLSVVFYGIFVAFPLLIALFVGAFMLGPSLRAIHARRFPPPGQKVFRPTKIKTGWRAVAIACVPIFIVVYLVGIGIWGIGQARDVIAQAHRNHPKGFECAVVVHSRSTLQGESDL